MGKVLGFKKITGPYYHVPSTKPSHFNLKLTNAVEFLPNYKYIRVLPGAEVVLVRQRPA